MEKLDNVFYLDDYRQPSKRRSFADVLRRSKGKLTLMGAVAATGCALALQASGGESADNKVECGFVQVEPGQGPQAVAQNAAANANAKDGERNAMGNLDVAARELPPLDPNQRYVMTFIDNKYQPGSLREAENPLATSCEDAQPLPQCP